MGSFSFFPLTFSILWDQQKVKGTKAEQQKNKLSSGHLVIRKLMLTAKQAKAKLWAAQDKPSQSLTTPKSSQS